LWCCIFPTLDFEIGYETTSSLSGSDDKLRPEEKFDFQSVKGWELKGVFCKEEGEWIYRGDLRGDGASGADSGS
jgi:hypothetical protein